MKKNTLIWTCILGIAAMAWVTSAETINQLKNPGFEEDTLQEWSTFGEGWSVTRKDIMTGLSAAENVITPTSKDEFRGIVQELPIIPGQLYVLRSKIKAYSLDNAEIYLELQFLDKDGKIVEQYQSPHIKKDQIFKESVVGPVEAPMGTDRASIRGIIYKDNKKPRPTSDTIVFDDVVFELIE